jgi:predicted amidohydrolase YtcJ
MKIFLALFLACFSNNILGQTQSLALTHIGVINMTNPHVLKDRTVIISDGKIIFIGKKYAGLKSCTTVDCKGKYLIPGLWDMHSHMIWKVRLPVFLNLYIANGVTGVRDMGSLFSEYLDYKKWKLSAQENHADVIHIITPGTFLDGPVPTNSASWAVKDTIDARKKVQELKEQGVDFIKVYNLLPRDVYFAILDEAKKQT